jgi:hypothetical protein
MPKKCCNENGDVRGMCFTCIGDLTKMSADTILRVRKCPSKNYAIAFWLWNNDCYKECRNLPVLQLLVSDWSVIDDYIRSFDKDDDTDDEDE